MSNASTPGSTGPSKALCDLAVRCSAEWSPGDPEGMASCYEETGQQSINDGPPAIGRKALAEVAASFMEAFPDLQVSLDHLLVAGGAAFFVWTLTGTNTGPGGTGRAVRVSGIEVWEMGELGLIRQSRGYYDAEEYNRQISGAF